MNDLITILTEYNPKSYTTLIQNRPTVLLFLRSQYGNDLSIIEMLWCYVNKTEPTKCHCGNIAKFNSFNKGYRKVCSVKCKGALHKVQMSTYWKNNPDAKAQMQSKKEKTNLQKYGVRNPALTDKVKEKTKATNLARYGAEFPLASAEIQSRIRQTMQITHGVDYPFQSTAVIKKGQDTTRNRYGNLMTQARKASYEKYNGVNPFASSEVKEKIKDTMRKKYGYSHALQSRYTEDQLRVIEDAQLFKNAITGLTIAEAALRIGVDEATVARRAILHDCKDLFAISMRSKWEFKMTTFLESLGLVQNKDFTRGDRTVLNGKELDFYLPSVKLAIEVGSIFWHSEVSAMRTRQYHYNKWKECKDQGITLLQYWDHEMINHWNVIESKIQYLLKKNTNSVGARQIQSIKKVSLQQERDFLNANHIQGQTNSSSLTLGAYHNNDLVAVMAFVNRRKDTEIVRFATKLDTVYPGLFTKMMKRGITELGLSSGSTVVSYSDNRHGNGAVYLVNGFIQANDPEPTYYYTRDYRQLENHKKFTKPKIAKKFGVDLTNKTEWQTMQELGYDRIWDAGKKKWVTHV